MAIHSTEDCRGEVGASVPSAKILIWGSLQSHGPSVQGKTSPLPPISHLGFVADRLEYN